MKNNCRSCKLAEWDADGAYCKFLCRQIPNPGAPCSQCIPVLAKNETRILKLDLNRKKSIKYLCTECYSVHWDLKANYKYCPHCGRKIIAR